MVLRVALEDFPEAVRMYAQAAEAFVSHSAGATLVSAVAPDTGVIVSATSELTVAEVSQLLQAGGIKVKEGEWTKAMDGDLDVAFYVAAVAYRSKEPTPGLWVDAFPRVPTVMDVLRRMFDEFVETGEASSSTFEQFMQSAQPNVLILSPDELKSFVGRHESGGG